MNWVEELYVIAILCITGSMLFVGWPGEALAQETNGKVPENAKARSYGDRWRCNPGNRESNGACAEIEIPENGHATSSVYGTGNVPAHGYLTGLPFGPGWQCDRGYRARGGACVAVTVPENAHLDYGGNDWECDQPYSRRSDRCVPPLSE